MSYENSYDSTSQVQNETNTSDDLENRRVLLQICRENYYDERGRTTRLDSKASGYLIFEVIRTLLFTFT